jgi:hypothetical protein
MLIMSMGWDYDSELRPPAVLSFFPQVIYEHGNHGEIMSTEENFWFVHQSSLANLSASGSHLVAKGGTWQRKWWICPCERVSFIIASYFLRAVKILWHWADCFTFLQRNLEFDGKHANHYTTEATSDIDVEIELFQFLWSYLLSRHSSKRTPETTRNISPESLFPATVQPGSS